MLIPIFVRDHSRVYWRRAMDDPHTSSFEDDGHVPAFYPSTALISKSGVRSSLPKQPIQQLPAGLVCASSFHIYLFFGGKAYMERTCRLSTACVIRQHCLRSGSLPYYLRWILGADDDETYIMHCQQVLILVSNHILQSTVRGKGLSASALQASISGIRAPAS